MKHFLLWKFPFIIRQVCDTKIIVFSFQVNVGVNATITKIHMLQKNLNKIIYFMSFMTSERKLSCLMQNVPTLISRFLLKAFRKEKLCYTTIKNMVVLQLAHVVVNYIYQDVRFWSYRSDWHTWRAPGRVCYANEQLYVLLVTASSNQKVPLLVSSHRRASAVRWGFSLPSPLLGICF